MILFARGADSALADAAGRPVARRIVETAWAGGATPIVVVCADPTGSVGAALAGSPAVLAEPAPVESGPVGQIIRGVRVAQERVTETDAAIIWPGRMAWVDAETITTLIEAHGAHRNALLRTRYNDELGWPALVPSDAIEALSALRADRMPDDLLGDLAATGVATLEVDTGDPGTQLDITTPMAQLPAYEGPPESVAGSAPEWGSTAAEMPDEAPLEGPALAPYGQAAEEGE